MKGLSHPPRVRKAERVVRRAHVLLARGGRLNMSFMGSRGFEAYADALVCLTMHHHPYGNDRLPETYRAMVRIARLTGNHVVTVIGYERLVRVLANTSLGEFMDAARIRLPKPDPLLDSVQELAASIDWLYRAERAYETGVFDYEPTAGMHPTLVIEHMIEVAQRYDCRVRADLGRIPVEVAPTSDPEGVHRIFLEDLGRTMSEYDLCA